MLACTAALFVQTFNFCQTYQSPASPPVSVSSGPDGGDDDDDGHDQGGDDGMHVSNDWQASVSRLEGR